MGFGQVVTLEGARNVVIGEVFRRLGHAGGDQHRDSVAQIDERGAEDFGECRVCGESLCRTRCSASGRHVSELLVLDPLGRFDLGAEESSYCDQVGRSGRRFLCSISDRANGGVEHDLFSKRILDRRAENAFGVRDRRHQGESFVQTRKQRGQRFCRTPLRETMCLSQSGELAGGFRPQ